MAFAVIKEPDLGRGELVRSADRPGSARKALKTTTPRWLLLSDVAPEQFGLMSGIPIQHPKNRLPGSCHPRLEKVARAHRRGAP